MRAVMRKALMLALGGNLGAIKFVAERGIGRAGEAPADDPPLDFVLPKLETIRDCEVAIDRVAAAMSARKITMDEAKTFVDLIGIRVKAIEVRDLEQRIVEMEKAAATVDLGHRN